MSKDDDLQKVVAELKEFLSRLENIQRDYDFKPEQQSLKFTSREADVCDQLKESGLELQTLQKLDSDQEGCSRCSQFEAVVSCLRDDHVKKITMENQSLIESMQSKQEEIHRKMEEISFLTVQCGQLKKRLNEATSTSAGQFVDLESAHEEFGQFLNAKLSEQESKLSQEKCAEMAELERTLQAKMDEAVRLSVHEERKKVTEEMACVLQEKLTAYCEKEKQMENVASQLKMELQEKNKEMESLKRELSNVKCQVCAVNPTLEEERRIFDQKCRQEVVEVNADLADKLVEIAQLEEKVLQHEMEMLRLSPIQGRHLVPAPSSGQVDRVAFPGTQQQQQQLSDASSGADGGGDSCDGADERNGIPPELEQHVAALADQAGISRQQLKDSPCPICGGRISGLHYGIYSCDSCKLFFYFTMLSNMTYECLRGDNCPVSKATCIMCQACWFNKCLKQGMKREGIRKDRKRGGRNTYEH